MHVVVIGGTGHVGTYLAPFLVDSGHQVTVLSRGQRLPYQSNIAWKSVNLVTVDRTQEEKQGSFGSRIRSLKPDIVIDMICFSKESAIHLVEALRDQVIFFLHCSTVWVHGRVTEVPVKEDSPRIPIDEYGIKKAAIESFLLNEAKMGNFPACCILPGHIVGPGWIPLNPQANFNPQVYKNLIKGETTYLPGDGTALLHHVHAEDVARLFMLALEKKNIAIGESFHAVSPAALTLYGYAQATAEWYDQKANICSLPIEKFIKTVNEEDARSTMSHLDHNPNCFSIEKAKQLLGYQPQFTSLEAVHQSLQWLIENGKITA